MTAQEIELDSESDIVIQLSNHLAQTKLEIKELKF